MTLKNIFEGGNYNFFYTAMVVSANIRASQWMNKQYSLYWVPTVYWDGGKYVGVGIQSESYYTARINASGSRAIPDLDLDLSIDWVSADTSLDIVVTFTNHELFNDAPDTPAKPDGPEAGMLDDQQFFSITPRDIDGDQVYCMWDWGDQTPGEWLGPYNSNEPLSMGHFYATYGTYSVKVKIKDQWDVESDWSNFTNILMYGRGDANGDFNLNVADAVFLINYVFAGGAAPTPISAGDANCDATTNIADAVYLINYTFSGGPPPQCE